MQVSKEKAMEIIADVFESLYRTESIESKVDVNKETVVLGPGSPLDSIGFVTFITELEDRLIDETDDDDIYLIINDIHEFNIASYTDQFLAVGVVAEFIEKLTEEL
jgi:acyl carrier protein